MGGGQKGHLWAWGHGPKCPPLDTPVCLAVLNVSLAFAVLLFFHFQVMEGHNQVNDKFRSGPILLYLYMMFGGKAPAKENGNEELWPQTWSQHVHHSRHQCPKIVKFG